MSIDDSGSADTTTATTDRDPQSRDDTLELAAQVEVLAAENRRLRNEYARARQSQYRYIAIGLAVLGLVAVLGGLLLPNGRQVLFTLGATGLFGGLLTYYLAPGQFVTADVGERVYAPLAANEAAIADELGLQDTRIYVPRDSGPVRLFVPQRATSEYPGSGVDTDDTDLTGPLVTTDNQRGLVLETTGAGLFREFERTIIDDIATTPALLATQLSDGLVEQFELARSVEPDVDAEDGRATVAVTDSAFGDAGRFDHPIASFLAVGFAAGLERPIELEVTPSDGRSDWLVTCRWETNETA